MVRQSEEDAGLLLHSLSSCISDLILYQGETATVNCKDYSISAHFECLERETALMTSQEKRMHSVTDKCWVRGSRSSSGNDNALSSSSSAGAPLCHWMHSVSGGDLSKLAERMTGPWKDVFQGTQSLTKAYQNGLNVRLYHLLPPSLVDTFNEFVVFVTFCALAGWVGWFSCALGKEPLPFAVIPIGHQCCFCCLGHKLSRLLRILRPTGLWWRPATVPSQWCLPLSKGRRKGDGKEGRQTVNCRTFQVEIL